MAITKTYNDTYNRVTTVNDNDIIVVQKGENSDLASMAKTTVQAIRQPLYDSIANASLAQTGTTGSFIEKVSESSGKISVTVTPFATGITNTTASQPVAPSADAVVKYVNAESATGAINTRITQRISELNANNVGATGSYIKTISESNGVITATSQAFDDTVSNNTGNIPSSKAVKDYVDNKIGTLVGDVGNVNTLVKSLYETSGVITGTTIALDSSSLASGVPTSQAVKNAISTLTGSVGASNAKLVTSITETDGKITGTTIDITNQVDTSANKIPTSKAVNDRIQTSIYSALSALDFPNASNANQSYGANGNYIKYVKQVDGQFTAEMKKFDTYTPVSGTSSPATGTWSATPSDDNAPTSEAVVDYVSTRFNALDYNLPGTGASGTFLRWVKQTDGQLDSSYVAFENNTTGIARGASDTAASAAATGLVYSSDSDRAPTVKAVASQVARLDKRADAIHAEVTGLNYSSNVTDGNYISGITQATGKISISVTPLAITAATGNKKAITSEAVRTAIDALNYNTGTTGTGGATGASGAFLRWVKQTNGQLDAKEISFENNTVNIAKNTSETAASAASPVYSSDADKAPTVKAVASQVARLDKRADAIHAEVTGLNYNTSVSDGYYISGITQATGKVSVATGALATAATTGNKKAITSEAVRTAIDALDYNTGKTGVAGTFLRWVSQTNGQLDSSSVSFKSDALASVALSASGIRSASSYAKATDTAPNVTIVSNEIDRLDARIDSINDKSTGPLGNTAGYYIYSIQQNKGNILAATASRFDTSVGPTTGTGAATNNNAPTSKAVRDAINALAATKVGADDSYLKTIEEKTGVITTTTKKFDNYTRNGWTNNGTGITPSNNNVPSTEAVENRVEEAKRQILEESEALTYLGKVNDVTGIITLASRAASSAGRENRYDVGDTFVAGANFNLTGATGITGTTGYQVFVGDMIITNKSSKAYSADIFDVIGGSDKTVLYESAASAEVGNWLAFNSSSGRLVKDSGWNANRIIAEVNASASYADKAASFASYAASSASFADAEVEPYRENASSSASQAWYWECSSASSARWANNRAESANSEAYNASSQASYASSSASSAFRHESSAASAASSAFRHEGSSASAASSAFRHESSAASAASSAFRHEGSSASAASSAFRHEGSSASAASSAFRHESSAASSASAAFRWEGSAACSAELSSLAASKAASFSSDANLEGIRTAASTSASYAASAADYSNTSLYSVDAKNARDQAYSASQAANSASQAANAASKAANDAAATANDASKAANTSSQAANAASKAANAASAAANLASQAAGISAACSASAANYTNTSLYSTDAKNARDQARLASQAANTASAAANTSSQAANAASAAANDASKAANAASKAANDARDQARSASQAANLASQAAGISAACSASAANYTNTSLYSVDAKNARDQAYSASQAANTSSQAANAASKAANDAAATANAASQAANAASKAANDARDQARSASQAANLASQAAGISAACSASAANYSNSTNYAASAASGAAAANNASKAANAASKAANDAAATANTASQAANAASKAANDAAATANTASKAANLASQAAGISAACSASAADYSNSTNYAASAASGAAAANTASQAANAASEAANSARDQANSASAAANDASKAANDASKAANTASQAANAASEAANSARDQANSASAATNAASKAAACSASYASSSAGYAATGFLDKVTTTAQTVAGYVSFSTGIQANSFTATSSRKVKENIHPTIISALDLIKTVDVVDFNYIADDEKTPHIGFIAEDTNTLLSTPHLNGMDYTNCIGTLLKAVQEITKGMEKLEKRIENLE